MTQSVDVCTVWIQTKSRYLNPGPVCVGPACMGSHGTEHYVLTLMIELRFPLWLHCLVLFAGQASWQGVRAQVLNATVALETVKNSIGAYKR